MKKIACKSCKILVTGDICPLCKKPVSKSKSVNWQGQINVLDPVRSKIAQKVGVKDKGEYAIKVN